MSVILSHNVIEILKRNYQHKPVYIIGKGASLDQLQLKHFEVSDAPIIAVNEAINKFWDFSIMNPLYCIVQDNIMVHASDRTILFLRWGLQKLYNRVTNKIIYYTFQLLHLEKQNYTSIYAIALAKLLGVLILLSIVLMPALMVIPLMLNVLHVIQSNRIV